MANRSQASLDKRRAASRLDVVKNKVHRERYRLKRFYGITPEKYEELLKKQNGVCAICHKPEVRIHYQSGKPHKLSVDHCHLTKTIRGLLCRGCNLGLGNFEDDILKLMAAIKYLENSNAK